MFIGWLKANPHQRKWAYAAVGILPFTINAINLDAALINWAGWPGYAKGIVLTLLDTLALALIKVRHRPFRNLPFLGLMIAYVLAAAVSMAFSSMAMSTSF